MASRRKRSSSPSRGAPRRPFFSTRVAGSANRAGRDPFVSSVRRELLRPTSLDFIVQADRDSRRPLVDLRSRSDRITPTWSKGPLRSRSAIRLSKPVIPLAKPVLSDKTSLCDRRKKRAEVLFSKGIAGRKWGRGGPNMRGARYSTDSFYKCGR